MAVPPAPPSGGGSSSSGGGASAGGVSAPIYSRVRLLDSGAGVWTTGASLDFSAQFDDLTTMVAGLQTVGGEIQVGDVLTGCCVDMAWKALNGYAFTMWVEASVAVPLQIYMNGDVTEITVSGPQTLVAVAGFNVLKFTRQFGPIIVLDQSVTLTSLSPWHSLYPSGSDPFRPGAAPTLASVNVA